MAFNPLNFVRQAAKNSPWLVIAIALHAAVIAVMSLIYLAGGLEKSNNTPTNVSLNTKLAEVIQPPEVIERKAPPKNAEEEIVDYEHEMQYVPTDVPEDLTKEVGDPTLENSSGATGGTAIAAGQGPGHFSTGLPSTRATRRAGMGNAGNPRGPTQGTEKAVRDGLLWLIRHQKPDGSWSATALPEICSKGAKCVADDAKFPEHGWQQGLTGLSLLAFLGAGYNFDSKQTIVDTVQAKKYRIGEVITNGLKWLKKSQQPDGSFGPEQHVYNQAICALALAEAYGLSFNRAWKEPAQKAIDWLVRAQKTNPDGGGGLWGWRYHSLERIQTLKAEHEEHKAKLDAVRAPFETKKEELKTKRQELETQKPTMKAEDYTLAHDALQKETAEVEAKLKETETEFNEVVALVRSTTLLLYDADLSVTTWVIMAFKSAEAAGLKIPAEAYEGGKRFVLSTSIGDGTAGYRHSAEAGRPVGGPGDHFEYHPGVMSALSMLCRTFIDHDIDDPFLEKAAQFVIKDLPDVSKDKLSIDYYYWYYASLAINQYDGPDSPRTGSRFWDQWNRAMQQSVLSTQDETEKACTRGGWVIGDRWSTTAGGPIYATAMNVLTLEVYYRYPNAFGAGTRFDVVKQPAVKPPDVKQPEKK